jgi:aromatic-L-amino-acid decarboxylase
MNRLNDSGKLFLSNTVLQGRFALRIAIGNIRTDERAVEAAWREIVEQAARITPEK